ncbi:terminase large subunit [Anaerotignum sp. MB30-C6]|uniref:terminase large subunit n=1 Tax=Anaerotignum sp. MB30-C6 TaxID=3070814 RepID=UPI0027DE63CA|nr:terminase TerL endonuclease subunit [Anaerotignum sp. MB30-C6]WMI80913.1 terminase large subunit [Anaerotignum sp. MB30-C6]
MILLERAVKYAKDVVAGKEITTKEVICQCKIFLMDYEERQYAEEFQYYFDEKELKKINNLLKLFNYATGFVAGKQVLAYLGPYQCFLITNVFAWRFKDNSKKFKHNDITLFIARKNAKTNTVALIFILLMLTEQEYSEFYSICLTKELAAEIRKAMVQLLDASPHIRKHFTVSKTLTGMIECKLTHSFYQPRTAESGKNNSVRPSAICSDEHANFQNADNFNALKGGQQNVINPLVFRTTTAYAISNSIMEEDIEYIRKVFDGVVEDERQFALLYYAEEEHLWDDTGIYQANPLRIEENYDIVRDNRKKAKLKPQEKLEYITKNMNNFLPSNSGDPYIKFDAWKKCRVESVDFEGKEVIVGVDASLTIDLTGMTIMYEENGVYYLKSHAFLPENTLEERREKIDYHKMQGLGHCTITPGDIVDYNLLKERIRGIEDKYKCKVKAIATDPYNIIATMQELAEEYDVIVLKQSYSVLSPSIKQFRDDVYKGIVKYEKNSLLDWNMSNTATVTGRTSGDILLNKVNKNKTRIDMVMATIFSYSQLFNQEKKVEYTEDYIKDFYGGFGVEKEEN